MKSMNAIVDLLKGRPHFKDIQKYSCFNKLKSLLPPRFAKAIAFFYIKNNTLFGGLSHPGYKLELNYNKDLVKGLLIELATLDLECKEIFDGIEKVEFFVSKYFAPAPAKFEDTEPFYQELADANFSIDVKDSDIKEIFLKIKEDIKRNNEQD
jgi:hypothetical protein